MKTFRVIAALFLATLMLSGCGGGSQGIESAAVSPEQTPTENQVNLEAKEAIKNQVLAYIDFNCTPKYETDVTDFGDGITTKIKNMKVFNESKFGIFNRNPEFGVVEDDYFINNDSVYGNLAVRTAYLSSAYHNSLSGLYSDIYDIYSTELKSLRKDYTRFKVIADAAGKKICPIVKKSIELEELDPTVIDSLQITYNKLSASWPAFRNWWDAANKLEENVTNRNSLEVEDAMTPKCDEYPTADGKYVVVKCTVPPG